MSFATAVSERFFQLPPTFSCRATFQVPAIFMRACKRSLPLESRNAIAAARISPPSSSASSWSLNFAMAESSDTLSTATTAVCSEAPPPESRHAPGQKRVGWKPRARVAACPTSEGRAIAPRSPLPIQSDSALTYTKKARQTDRPLFFVTGLEVRERV